MKMFFWCIYVFLVGAALADAVISTTTTEADSGACCTNENSPGGEMWLRFRPVRTRLRKKYNELFGQGVEIQLPSPSIAEKTRTIWQNLGRELSTSIATLLGKKNPLPVNVCYTTTNDAATIALEKKSVGTTTTVENNNRGPPDLVNKYRPQTTQISILKDTGTSSGRTNEQDKKQRQQTQQQQQQQQQTQQQQQQQQQTQQQPQQQTKQQQQQQQQTQQQQQQQKRILLAQQQQQLNKCAIIPGGSEKNISSKSGVLVVSLSQQQTSAQQQQEQAQQQFFNNSRTTTSSRQQQALEGFRVILTTTTTRCVHDISCLNSNRSYNNNNPQNDAVTTTSRGVFPNAHDNNNNNTVATTTTTEVDFGDNNNNNKNRVNLQNDSLVNNTVVVLDSPTFRGLFYGGFQLLMMLQRGRLLQRLSERRNLRGLTRIFAAPLEKIKFLLNIVRENKTMPRCQLFIIISIILQQQLASVISGQPCYVVLDVDLL